MDYTLDDSDRALVADLEQAFAGIADRAQAADSAGELPEQNWTDVIDSGYLKLFHPAEIGGMKVNGVAQALAMETLAKACPSTFWSATMSGLECVKLIQAHGDPVEHRALLGQLIRGERVGCFAVVENTSGCDVESYRSTVRRDGSGYVLDGEKTRITNATTADVAVVLARFPETRTGWCYAFVDLRQPGVRTSSLPHMGLRAMPWGGVVFDAARLSAADVVPVDLRNLREGVGWGWLFMSIAAIGVAESALTAAVRHARRHVAFGRPLGHMEGVRDALARTRVEIDAARLLAHRCAWHRGEGRPVQDLLGMLKPFATEMAVRAVECAVQVHGACALTPGHPVERLYRDAPMHLFGGFAANRQRELVAEELGLTVTYQEHGMLMGTGLDKDAIGLPGPRGRERNDQAIQDRAAAR
ncbi:acyl-CoA dehydrogenase family protein [Amycolatopsis speibonae]|uniref:Acyl-CoA dehydrogenase family protein n=1 Tax=Amycolatopsis speibonae TaxID=1450224 RepID=A0ABV7PAW6_9PSEU